MLPTSHKKPHQIRSFSLNPHYGGYVRAQWWVCKEVTKYITYFKSSSVQSKRSFSSRLLFISMIKMWILSTSRDLILVNVELTPRLLYLVIIIATVKMPHVFIFDDGKGEKSAARDGRWKRGRIYMSSFVFNHQTNCCNWHLLQISKFLCHCVCFFSKSVQARKLNCDY